MGAFVRGDVVVVPFPFSDLSATKRRPALVVATLSGVDVMLCQITSQASRDASAIPLLDVRLGEPVGDVDQRGETHHGLSSGEGSHPYVAAVTAR